jgi:hypothetical protein
MGWVAMDRRHIRGFNAAAKEELWDRWQRGESLKAIGRAFGKPSLRLISRLTVDGEWPSNLAIERIDRAEATPREISSRSASVNASRERRRGTGRMPPCGAT